MKSLPLYGTMLLIPTANVLAWAAPTSADFLRLLPGKTDPRGPLLRPTDFDLSRPNARWQNQPGLTMTFEQTWDDRGCWRLDVDLNDPTVVNQQTIHRRLWSIGTFPLKFNRRYRLVAVIKTDFPRDDCEINLYLHLVDANGKQIGPVWGPGVPAKTQGPDGWQRFEWTTTPYLDDGAVAARCGIQFVLGKPHRTEQIGFRIADYAFVELPAQPLKPFARGEGVTFPGGPGHLPMSVEAASTAGSVVSVSATGATYRFDTATGRFSAHQRIDFPRELGRWQCSESLTGLRVLRQTKRECVLGNDAVTMGVQCDGVLVIAPHREMSLTLENRLGGPWNRFNPTTGDLISEDDFGGMLIRPHIPLGSGRRARAQTLTEGLDFVGWRYNDTEKLSNAQPGWQVRWTLSPGERLFLSTYPPRPFDWERSFRETYFLTYMRASPEIYTRNYPWVTMWVLWDFTQRAWGMSWGPRYIPLDEAALRRHLDAIHAAGAKALPYTSAWFYYSRDPEEFVGEIRRWKETYGIDGIYSDGLPGSDWLAGYLEMRLLRELFPDGALVIHDSGPQTGNDMNRFVHTYADITLLAENVRTEAGPEWPYARYVANQFRKANCLGDLKGDAWPLETYDEALINLVYNGRSHTGASYTNIRPDYAPLLEHLETLWRAYGKDPYFYDRYYLPVAQRLTGFDLGRAGMPIVKQRPAGDGAFFIALECWTPRATIHYTTDGTPPTAESAKYVTPLRLPAGTTVRAVALRKGLDPSRELVFEVGTAR